MNSPSTWAQTSSGTVCLSISQRRSERPTRGQGRGRGDGVAQKFERPLVKSVLEYIFLHALHETRIVPERYETDLNLPDRIPVRDG